MVGSGGFPPDDWHGMAAGALRKVGLGAPPIAVAIPEDPTVREAQNDGKLASLASDSLARGIHTLADALFGGGSGAPGDGKGRGLRIGGLRLRFRR